MFERGFESYIFFAVYPSHRSVKQPTDLLAPPLPDWTLNNTKCSYSFLSLYCSSRWLKTWGLGFSLLTSLSFFCSWSKHGILLRLTTKIFYQLALTASDKNSIFIIFITGLQGLGENKKVVIINWQVVPVHSQKINITNITSTRSYEFMSLHICAGELKFIVS